jgi:hypothetical protein
MKVVALIRYSLPVILTALFRDLILWLIFRILISFLKVAGRIAATAFFIAWQPDMTSWLWPISSQRAKVRLFRSFPWEQMDTLERGRRGRERDLLRTPSLVSLLSFPSLLTIRHHTLVLILLLVT